MHRSLKTTWDSFGRLLPEEECKTEENNESTSSSSSRREINFLLTTCSGFSLGEKRKSLFPSLFYIISKTRIVVVIITENTLAADVPRRKINCCFYCCCRVLRSCLVELLFSLLFSSLSLSFSFSLSLFTTERHRTQTHIKQNTRTRTIPGVGQTRQVRRKIFISNLVYRSTRTNPYKWTI